MIAASIFDIQLTGQCGPMFRHTLDQLFKHVQSTQRSNVAIGIEGSEAEIQVSNRFCERIQQGPPFVNILDQHPEVRRKDGSIDHLSTLMYMVNYLQEYGRVEQDDIGRFPFYASYQKRFDVVSKALVLYHFKKFLAQYELGKWIDQPSRLFVSHDNDGLFRSFKQDGKFALSKGRLDWLLRIVFSEAIRKPRWFNMDRIMDINDEYDLKSTFFWLVEQGDVELESRRLRNSDYAIDDPRIQRQMKKIEARGFEQGLHKSISSYGFDEEIALLPFACQANRNHFLRLQIPEHFQEMEDAGLKLDFSLGFAEEFGLRNNYALPYQPYDLNHGQASSVLYVPLMIMDTTNWTYKQHSIEEFRIKALSLIEEHEQNAVISILWHNKYFTDMKFEGYLQVYRSILDLCRERGIAGVSQQELLNQYTR
ncbi:MAG: hypothetical protein HQ500_11750 [Flavobacteriales bacterium]|nr:hypothetical protein [Flavobacteriales bacterium]